MAPTVAVSPLPGVQGCRQEASVAVLPRLSATSTVPLRPGQRPGTFNRLIESEVSELAGHKSLYSDSYYDEDEFWRLYNRPAHERLKKRYDPFNLFYAVTAVGSEFFEVRSVDNVANENGRLCRKSDPELYTAEGPDWQAQYSA